MTLQTSDSAVYSQLKPVNMSESVEDNAVFEDIKPAIRMLETQPELSEARSEMDKYLLGLCPPVQILSDKKYRRESASVVDEFFESEKPPFSVNINFILPDTSHLRTGLYRQSKTFTALPQIKSEPDIDFPQPCSASLTQTLPDFTSVFSMPHSVAVNNIFIKQEAPSEVPLSNSDNLQTQLYHMSVANDALNIVQSNGGTSAENAIAGSTMTMVNGTSSLTQSTRQHLGKQFQCLAQEGTVISRQFYPSTSVTLPPSPPNSQPGSPVNQLELINTISPPPSYGATFGLKLVQAPSVHSVPNSLSVLPQGQVIMAVPRYNRRNNPELEKRRIHHCEYPGEEMFYLNML
ncbi:hypothetical protein GDO78_014579 [Eleutherodactylus coqui]|uniref:Uncharacterized protein n=1 Tax=Eleutherodactylus coqui TaxID=57060 RepID=A0A8J6JKP2_ELECQ|nr:hypothetical protein GDO78_014579 [Eleutherodactylus coqui]